MKTKNKLLCLVDMDVGLFVSYEIAADSFSTKLFHCIKLGTTPLDKLKEFRIADSTNITPLNRVNWFDFSSRRKSLCPVYTVRATEKSPRLFMKLNEGSHMVMKRMLEQMHD